MQACWSTMALQCRCAAHRLNPRTTVASRRGNAPNVLYGGSYPAERCSLLAYRAAVRGRLLTSRSVFRWAVRLAGVRPGGVSQFAGVLPGGSGDVGGDDVRGVAVQRGAGPG